MPRQKRRIGYRHKAGTGDDKHLKASRRIKPHTSAADTHEPSRPTRTQPRRGEKQPKKPKPRGPPLRKPKQLPAAELSPASLEKRHDRDRAYSRAYNVRKRDAKSASLDAAADPYKRTRTGNLVVLAHRGRAHPQE